MLIAIEGCLGAGKSTVAAGLARYRGSGLLLEDFEANPFLRAFYEDPRAYALETEFAFLLVHFHQLKRHSDRIREGELISDFHLGKDLLYTNLNVHDLGVRAVFAKLYNLCMETASSPSLLVFLSAPTDFVIERIQRRSREFELQVDLGYYSAVNEAYEEYFGGYTGGKLRVPMDQWDFVKRPELFSELSCLVDEALARE